MNTFINILPIILFILIIYFIFLIIVRYVQLININKNIDLEDKNKEDKEFCDSILEKDYSVKMYLKSYSITGNIAYFFYKLFKKRK